jgi:hypothetical protein
MGAAIQEIPTKNFFFSLVLVLAAPAFASIAQVQSKANWSGGATSCTVTPTSGTNNQNLAVVWTLWTSTSALTASVSDIGVNTWYSAVGPTLQSTSNTSAQLFYAKNITGTTNPITVTFSGGSASSSGCVFVEYSGLDQNYPLDNASAAYSYSAGSLLDSGAVAPANANLLVFGGGIIDTGTAVAGGGFTAIQSHLGAITEQNTTAITGNNVLQRATAGLSACCATGNWVMQMAVFRDASWGLGIGNPVLAGGSLVGNTGVFTNTQINAYAQSLVNGANPGSMFSGIQTNFPTGALVGAATTPIGNGTNCCTFGVMGLVENHTTFATTLGAGTGVYGQGVCVVSNCFVEGGNFLATARGSSLTGLQINGLELDVNIPSGLTASALNGIEITGGTGSIGTIPALASAILVTNPWQWPIALNCNRGSTSVCVMADGQVAAPTATNSSQINLQSWTSGTPGTPVVGYLLQQEGGGGSLGGAASLLIGSPHGVTIGGGINPSAPSTGVNTGFQHIRVSGCATAASLNATCDTTVTWTTAFFDTSYTATCTGDAVTSGVPIVEGMDISSAKTASAITVRTLAITGVAAQFTKIDCIAVHD